MIDHKLPETATMLAVYLREVTGNQRIFARLIGPNDPDSNDPGGIAYMSIGELDAAGENELFVLTPPATSFDWSLARIFYHSGTYQEPPSADCVDILMTPSLPQILGKMAEVIFQDRLATAQLCLEHDRHDLYNPEPAISKEGKAHENER